MRLVNIPMAPLMFVTLIAGCASVPIDPSRFVVFGQSEGIHLLDQCSRSSPQGVQEFWSPTSSQIEELESALNRLPRVRARKCCFIGGSIQDPGSAYRQYVGIIVGARRLIYLNAFYGEQAGWRENAMVYCDGGTSAWGVVYDPKTGDFEDLAINGEAQRQKD